MVGKRIKDTDGKRNKGGKKGKGLLRSTWGKKITHSSQEDKFGLGLADQPGLKHGRVRKDISKGAIRGKKGVGKATARAGGGKIE